MKQTTISLFIILCFAMVATAQKSVPDVNVKTLDGKVVNLKDYTAKSGKIIVIDFWATWCGPCREELDVISEVYPDWQEKYDIELIAISIDNQRAIPKLPGFVAARGWEYTIFNGNEEEMRNAFNFQAPPFTQVVDKSGKVVFEHNGFMHGDEEELEKAVAKAAGK